MNRRVGLCGAALLGAVMLAGAGLWLATWRALQPFPHDLAAIGGTVRPQILARDGTPLSFTLENAWNCTDVVPLSAIPPLLQRAFIVAEDRHFYEHHGVDWAARLAAVWQDGRAGAAVRGASTITEQVVRMLHPRSRTLWSRWVEGFEAARLESAHSKAQILAFYLNQVPYTNRRRGVVQAARMYFDRGLDTLLPEEQLALAVLVRSPGGMDLRRNQPRAQRAIDQLADRMLSRGELDTAQRRQVGADRLTLATAAAGLDASHFVNHVMGEARRRGDLRGSVHTTLDPHFQALTQRILDAALASLARRKVGDGAVLVIDNRRNEIQAWVVGRADTGEAAAGYDTVLTPRQPGSTLKPLLYALALERGWTAATLIDDSELAEPVADGQHVFHNYSHLHYGPLRLREALGNSLNIPAVRTLRFVGRDRFLDRLHALGVTSLTQHPDYYGDGLALGNGEVTLFEMAQAYTALARGGRYRPLTAIADAAPTAQVQVMPPEIAALIGNILADPEARMREFGKGLQFPIETAIKTGTSTDYRDAWAIAYDYRHTVAAWMGNLDGTATNGVTGAVGPAMLLRSVFSELNRNQDTRGLPMSPLLAAHRICRRDGSAADGRCESTTEWFTPGTGPEPARPVAASGYRLLQPTPGLQVAHDPRIPPEFEALPMKVAAVIGLRKVDWYVDGREVGTTGGDTYAWPLSHGSHEVYSRIWDRQSAAPHSTEVIRFQVH